METVFDIIERHWRSAPVDIAKIIAEAGVAYKEEVLASDLSGYIEASDSRHYRIVVNSQHPLVRRRFTAAHELGHFVYHRDQMGKGVNDSRAYRSAPGSPFYNSSILPRHETQANRFAATVLMPGHLLTALQKAGNSVPAMARALEVSEAALKIRLGIA